MKKIYNEMSQLNDFGKEATQGLKALVQKFLSECNDQAEIDTVGSLLKSVVSNEITDRKVSLKKKDE